MPIRLQPSAVKVDLRIRPESIPLDLALPEVEVVLGDCPGAVVLRARLNAKSARRALATLRESGAENCGVSLAGTLKRPAAPGGPLIIDSAGIQVFVKAPRPAPEVAP